MSTTQAAGHGHGPERDDAPEIEIQDVPASEAPAIDRRSRRRFLRQALGGAGVLALSASGAVALRRADAKDDDDDDNGGGDDNGGHGGDDSGGDDNSGSGSGGGGDNSGSGSGGGDDNSGSGSGSGSGGGSDDNSGHGGDDDPPGDDHGGDDHGGDDDDDDDDNSGPGGGDDDDDDDDHGRHGDDDDRIAGTPVAGVTEVRITDDDSDGFEPQMITVDLGAKVTFFNDDHHDHTATGGGFDTGVIKPGESATITLDEPGSHVYACQIHPQMTGTIFVRDEDGNVPGATPRAIEATNANASGETVSIVNFAFDPASLTVAVGTSVTWENTDTAPHTATADDGSFDTGGIGQNERGSVTFDQAGTFAYHCDFHPNMQATITVE